MEENTEKPKTAEELFKEWFEKFTYYVRNSGFTGELNESFFKQQFEANSNNLTDVVTVARQFLDDNGIK